MNNSLRDPQVGDYEVVKFLGAGAMGEVYETVRDGERFAIKIMHEELAENDKLRERFLREVNLMQSVRHAHIIPISDFGWHGKRLFLVMPYIDGISLFDVMQTHRFSPRQVWEIFYPLTEALKHAHVQGIIHRDLKPGNVLIARPDNHVYLADFGLGKRPGLDTRLTETGVAIGTPSYMSPEAIVGEEIDVRSDVYSLGVLLYELLLDQLPFDGIDSTAIMYAQLYNSVPLPTAINSRFPFALEAVILRALAKDKQDRYSSVRHFVDDLADALNCLSAAEVDCCYSVPAR
ncbi:MAG TPA: serine/threonine-protein kinase [Phototrophicaceae bacterium]|nr:serine/threonine-protein kinase [Phototrophicaceae bacterium]